MTLSKLASLSLLLTTLFVLATSCTTKPVAEVAPKKSETNKSPALKSCICVKMYMPVCGSDKKTYGNACEADCRGIDFTQGACEDLN